MSHFYCGGPPTPIVRLLVLKTKSALFLLNDLHIFLIAASAFSPCSITLIFFSNKPPALFVFLSLLMKKGGVEVPFETKMAEQMSTQYATITIISWFSSSTSDDDVDDDGDVAVVAAFSFSLFTARLLMLLGVENCVVVAVVLPFKFLASSS
ncbi:hypothetical protein FF38_01576 [Lucilia cuprina]|uniref:Uncharacterized protein n=1 Tax=Lucilia cuprina TaxID=7375 RepID=A0A0L0CH81_LUCCU|nr:hypothetical protein FF38_01576 [Lucilia cuprina]